MSRRSCSTPWGVPPDRRVRSILDLMASDDRPLVFDIIGGQALDVRKGSYGSVGRLFADERIEMVWVSKQDEEIDPGWFEQDAVDLLLVLKGQLKVEYEREDLSDHIVDAGQLLVLPANTRCRAYRWPRDRPDASVFVAVYPAGNASARS